MDVHPYNYEDSYYSWDQPCQCFDCYTGADCSQIEENCNINVGLGDIEMFADYWEEHHDLKSAAVLSPAWYRMPYSGPNQISSYSVSLNDQLTATIRNLHERVGNAETEGYKVVIGVGAAQLIRLFTRAVAIKQGGGMMGYTEPPYYPPIKDWIGENPQYTTFNASKDMNPADVIEIVTHPANPLGNYYDPAYPNGHLIYDLVYYWPYCTEIDIKYDESIMIFSLSKMTGHAGTRFGWALVDDPIVAGIMIGLGFLDTLGISIQSQFQALRIIQTLNDQMDSGEETMYDYGRDRLLERWDLMIVELSQREDLFRVESPHGFLYAWVRCLNSSISNSCDDQFKHAGIAGAFGEGTMGNSNPWDHVRLNLGVRQSNFDLFINRLRAMMRSLTAKL
eukprot:TRINITY_DN16600_c0_g1_i1.p1 TRINITY_DN16600_c0_g1~~TRINITY_DN16600_c0_g1_i1.p1  ORF type:complete len:455 (+),score=47.64 TRINITY_DN16600_c0_g1_i1:187-1365(+)